MTQPNATRSKTAAELKANPEPAQRTGKILGSVAQFVGKKDRENGMS
jgi:hypothetical protein